MFFFAYKWWFIGCHLERVFFVYLNDVLILCSLLLSPGMPRVHPRPRRREYLCSCSVHRLQGADSPIAKPGAQSEVPCCFEMVIDSTPTGFVSFERKVLPRRGLSDSIPYPDIHAWLASSAPLCQFRVRDHCILMGTQEKDEGQKYHFLWPVYAVKSSWRAMSAKIARMYQMLSFNGKYV